MLISYKLIYVKPRLLRATCKGVLILYGYPHVSLQFLPFKKWIHLKTESPNINSLTSEMVKICLLAIHLEHNHVRMV